MNALQIRITSLLLLTAMPVAAHEAPNRVIDDLTHRIEQSGPSPRLLTARAYEYRAVGALDAAAEDFHAALDRDPEYAAAVHGLARVYLDREDYTQAIATARRGLALSDAVDDEAPYHAIAARAFAAQGRWDESRNAWRAALRASRPEVDWFIGEAECLARLGRISDRADALSDAVARNASAVLRRMRIAALIDAGDLEPAATQIERGLANTRWRASWLLLRARLRQAEGNVPAAQADAAHALEEIQLRLNPEFPDPYLFADAALAHALVGDRDRAWMCLRRAKALGVAPCRLYDIQRCIGAE